jgi:hypoxanthine-DNA glycosylase
MRFCWRPAVRRESSPRLKGFPPVIDRRVERLILGSFPSEASLAAGQYYAHPRNQFWRLLGDVIDEPLHVLPYEARLRRLLARRIGIWDVLAACKRTGSLDSAITDSRANPFARLRQLAPALRDVAFNGQTAGRFAPVFRDAGYSATVLPSSSPAHAGRSYEQKRALWLVWWAGHPPDPAAPVR